MPVGELMGLRIAYIPVANQKGWWGTITGGVVVGHTWHSMLKGLCNGR